MIISLKREFNLPVNPTIEKIITEKVKLDTNFKLVVKYLDNIEQELFDSAFVKLYEYVKSRNLQDWIVNKEQIFSDDCDENEYVFLEIGFIYTVVNPKTGNVGKLFLYFFKDGKNGDKYEDNINVVLGHPDEVSKSTL